MARRMKTKAQIAEEIKKILEDHAERMSYGGPVVGRDWLIHQRSAIQALMWALGVPTFHAPSKGPRAEDMIGR